MQDPPPPTKPRHRLNPIPDNPYWIVGLMLIVANVLPGILLFAFVASLVGEDVLEGADGPTWLGAALIYLPPIVGLMLVLFGRPLSRGPLSPERLWVPVSLAVFGVVGTILGAIGASDTSRGANIGAGLLLLFCPFLAVAALAWAVWIFRNKREPKQSFGTYT